MLDFVARVFRSWVSIILWIIIIGCTIIGVSLGVISDDLSAAVFLAMVGGLIGFIIVILFGGFIANFLNMVDNIEKQNNLLKELLGKNTSAEDYSISNKNIIETENKIKDILKNVSIEINIEELKTRILIDKNKIDKINEILETKGKDEMNRYIKIYLNKNTFYA